MRDLGKPNVPYAADNARYLMAVLAHYMEDAHVPFHGALNYDGQMIAGRRIFSCKDHVSPCGRIYLDSFWVVKEFFAFSTRLAPSQIIAGSF